MRGSGSGAALLPRALVAVVVAIAATGASLHLFFRRPESPGQAIQALYAGTPLADPYEELPEFAKPAPPPVMLGARLDRTASVERYLITSGLSRSEAHEWAHRFRRVAGTGFFRRGHWLAIYKDPDTGSVRGIKYNLNRHVEIFEKTLGAGLIQTDREPIEYVQKPVSVAFAVRGNFRRSAFRNQVPRSVVNTLENAFDTRHSLNRLPSGSVVKLLYTKRVSRDGMVRMPGHVEAAEIRGGGETLTAFALPNHSGDFHLYDEDGNALGPQFLRFPVRFRYISSGFTFHRWHPILHRYRPHVGVDLVARRGTPVKSIADGRVVTAGWCGELGRCVRIQHRDHMVSIYGHLSRLGHGVRRGRFVSMGEVIGYVGSTGLSTGPHLHFGLEKRGHYVNPLTQKLGVHHHVSPRMKALFDRLKQRYETALAKLPNLGHGFAYGTMEASSASGRDQATRVSLRETASRHHRHTRRHRAHRRARVVRTVDSGGGAAPAM